MRAWLQHAGAAIGHAYSAARAVVRGSVAPFNQIPVIDGGADGQPLRQPYAQSIWIHAAIRHIANPICVADLEHEARDNPRSQTDATIEDPRLDAFWEEPARGVRGFAEFIRATVGWRKVAGEAFWLLGDNAVNAPFPEVLPAFPQLILARPDRMRHVVQDGQIVAWEYTDHSGRRHALLPEQVIHLVQWNPYDDHRGLGEAEVAAIAAEADHASAQFTRNLASSNGDRGPYIIGKNGVITEEQRKQIVAAIRQKRQLQARGQFAPAFLTGDIEVQDPQIRAVDTAFLDSRRMSAEEIFIAFGVPPSMTTKAASYSIGSASDYYRLILDTCMPESEQIAAGIARVSSILLRRPVCSEFCWDEHPVLQEVRKERIASATQLWDRGVPMATVSEYLDLGLPRYTGDTTGYLPMSAVPTELAGQPIGPAAANEPADPAPTAPPAPEPAPTMDPVEEALAALRIPPQSRRAAASGALWARHLRARAGSVRAYRSAMGRALIRARAAVLRKIEAHRLGKASGCPQDESAAVIMPPKASGASYPAAVAGRDHVSGDLTPRSGAIDLSLEEEDFRIHLRDAFRSGATQVLQTATEQLSSELGLADPLRYPPERAVQFIRDRENKLSGVSGEVFDSIRSQIQAGLDGGDTTKELADRVRSVFNEASRGRAERIAMTETAAAYGVARQDGMTQAGVGYKQWITSHADNVRPAHQDAEGQTVPVDEPFTVGGEALMHPGDPAGSPGNVINCHCVAVAVAAPQDPNA